MQLIDDFIADMDLSPGTCKLYKKTLHYWVNWSVEHQREFRDVVPADLVTYKRHLKDKGVSASTIDSYLTSVRKFCRWLVGMEYIAKNPAEQLGWTRDRHGTFIKQSLSIEQVFKLMEVHKINSAVSKRNFALIDLMAFTGLRCIEVTRLNIGDIKNVSGRWILQVWRKGHNEKSGIIVVPEDRIKTIKEYWNYRPGDLNDNQPVFVNHSPRSSGTRLTPVCISRIIKATLRKIGLNSNKYTAHSLRHTAATLAYKAGSENWEIQLLLGHANPRQTEHYLRALGIQSVDQGRATEKINDYALKQRIHNKKPIKSKE
ncbi:MAG TPA: tyrosine-type recombinase/integrase [Bacteroidales bacterium]|nr:tyrosine-type recombinase/integrase [Bacteroidales bacterium]